MQNSINQKQLDKLTIEVAYAGSNNVTDQLIISLQVKIGTTIRQAIEQSGILQRFAEINLNSNQVGIFGQIKSLNSIVADLDRIEIYRHLSLNPNQIRQQRMVADR
jgi:putative ubiquitin-RnfH superfamily antitoxin RatB of RatAB toxin-antitoxin module